MSDSSQGRIQDLWLGGGAWVGEGAGDRLRSQSGLGQSPCRGPRGVKLMTDRSRYFNPSKNYWFSFNAFLISLIDLYFWCLSFRVVLVNTAHPNGAFLFVVWFIHWKRMIRPFLFIDKQNRKLSIHKLVVDFWLANVAKLDDQNRFMQH